MCAWFSFNNRECLQFVRETHTIARLNDVDCVVIAFSDDGSFIFHAVNVDSIVLASCNN